MKLSFLLLIFALIFLELSVLRFKSALAYRNTVLAESEAVLPLKNDPALYGNGYQILDFGYFKAGTYSKETFRVGDTLNIKSEPICSDEKCDTTYRKASFIRKVGETRYAGIMRVFSRVRSKINDIYIRNLSSPYAELLAGMTLGIKNLPEKFNEDLIKTGVIHVVVVSGFNVSLVISALFPLLLFLGRKASLAVSFLGVLLFVFLVGFEPPIIRAAIMGLIMLYGKYKGREKNVLGVLLLAAFVMIFISPLIIYSLSFILSFLATLGLIALSPLVKKYVKLKFYGLEEDFVSTMSAQIMVWPIISYYFGRISVVSPLVNVLVLWVVPLATVMGFLYMATAFILEVVKFKLALFVVSLVVKIPLVYFSQVVSLFANLSFSQIEFQVTKGFMAIYYLVLAVSVLWLIKKKELVLR
ncbi:MAG: ComEC/Rec2 family competence protein, partial [Patescibacteria group bacterium]